MSSSNSMSNSIRRHGRSPTSHHGSADQQDLPLDMSQHSSGHHHHHHHHPHHCDPEWEAKEELRLRELEEARARATQMEKTMRWWSDCTANWREKWSKVRTERNKAREESRMLRSKLEVASKECNLLKREREELANQVEKLQKEVSLVTCSVLNDAERSFEKFDKREDSSYVPPLQSPIHISEKVVPERDVGLGNGKLDKKNDSSQDSHFPLAVALDPFNNNTRSAQTMCDTELLSTMTINQDLVFLDKLFHPKGLDAISLSDSTSPIAGDKRNSRSFQRPLSDECSGPIQEIIEQKISMLQLRLEETSKTITSERLEKNKLNKNMEKVQSELSHLRVKYEDLKKTKQDTLKELNQIKAEHQDELDSIRLDLEDEANNRSSLDQRLSELRSELERLQTENAAEWGRRERLETEKLNLERENKKLRTQIEDMEERLERKTKQMTSASDSDVKTIQQELHEKNKELTDLKHAHGKLKKILQDKTTELSHASRRSEQYETEVKKLRGRIEELKKELATAEDEIDSASNSIRKIQRSNDELQEQVEGLQMEVEHLQSRQNEVEGSTKVTLIASDREPSTIDETSHIKPSPYRRASE